MRLTTCVLSIVLSGLAVAPAVAQPVTGQLVIAQTAAGAAAGAPSSVELSTALYQDLRWRLIGPFRGGRTVAAAGIPDAPNVAYVGVTDGGVWRTTDFGQTWMPIFDGQPTQSVGAIAIAPSDPKTIYVGSGEGLRRPDLSTGDGIYKSTDGGATWTHLGLQDSQQIGAIVVDPRDPNRVFAAVLGHPYGPNAERGVYRSTDGAKTWTKVLYKNEDTGAIDLAFDPTNPSTLYATLWVSRRPPWHLGPEMEAPGSGLYVSHDEGDSWAQLTGGLPGDKEHVGRIGIGIAPSDPRRMYAWVEADEAHGGIYRSDDAGSTWRRVNSEQRVWGRGDDFACVRVDPRNPDRVYAANTSTYRSDDGGTTFVAIKGAPGGDDYHTIWINPQLPNIILIASDQGATISVNGGATWSSWYNQPTAQFFHVITDNRFPYWVYGAQQESGSAGVASRSDFGEITFRDWHPVGVEEYGYVAPDPLDPNIIYGGKAQRYDQRTGQLQDISPVVLADPKYRYDRTAPIAFSPADPHALYLGSSVLFKTVNGGHSWKIVSPDLTREHPETPRNVGVFWPKAAPRGEIFSLGLSFRNPDVIWVGTDDGLIWRTGDVGRSWKNVTPGALSAWSKIATLEVSHYDDETAYAAVSRYRLDDLRPYIYKTHDGGKTWRNVVEGIADDAPVNVVREDPVRKGLLYAGTERAVYVSFDDGERWLPLQFNLPSTSMRDLTVHADDLIVGTHGRSFWILDDIAPLREVSTQIADAPAHLFRPRLTYRMQRDQNTDTPLPPEVPAGQNPPDGAIIDYYLAKHSTGIVALEVDDSRGRLVRRYESTDRPPIYLKDVNVPTYWIQTPRVPSAAAGMHRFVWDMRYRPPYAVNHNYPISAIYGDTPADPRGQLALPGQYTVRLIVDGKSYSQPLTLRIDPRLATTSADLAKQFETSTALAAMMKSDSELLDGVHAVQSKLKGGGGDALATLESDLTDLNDQMSGLFTSIEGADRAPTEQQLEAVSTLRRELATDMANARSLGV